MCRHGTPTKSPCALQGLLITKIRVSVQKGCDRQSDTLVPWSECVICGPARSNILLSRPGNCVVKVSISRHVLEGCHGSRLWFSCIALQEGDDRAFVYSFNYLKIS